MAKEIVSENQNAFMLGRSIAKNTLLTDQLLHEFGRARSPKRCCLCVYLMKAFDALRWYAILNTFEAMGLSRKFRDIIKNCIQTPSFLVMVEGSPSRPFKSKEVLEKGTLSPPSSSFGYGCAK